jgi:hypothetical protein
MTDEAVKNKKRRRRTTRKMNAHQMSWEVIWGQ